MIRSLEEAIKAYKDEKKAAVKICLVIECVCFSNRWFTFYFFPIGSGKPSKK